MARGTTWRRGAGRRIGCAVAAALAGVACDRHPGTRPTALPEDGVAAVDALLARWHGPLRGTLHAITTELRAGSAAGDRRTLDLDGPRMRVRTGGAAFDLLLPDAAWRCGDGTAPTRLSEPEREALTRLRELVAGAYLLPLYGAKSIARRGPTVFAAEASDGSTWRLEIDAATQLPRSITGAAGEVRFLTFFATGVTELPADVELGSLGRQHLRLVAHGVLFDPAVFRDPAAGVPPPRKIVRRGGEEGGPALATLDERQFLVLADPGDWPARAAAIDAAHRALAEQGQTSAGLPFLYEAGGERKIGIPFTPAGPDGKPLVPRPGQVVDRRPRQSAVAFTRPKEEFAASLAAGARTALDYAARNDLKASGPLRVIPAIAWEDGAPSAAQLAAVRVRFELPVEQPPK